MKTIINAAWIDVEFLTTKRGNILIDEGRITRVGIDEIQGEVIDARGLTLAPAFIDPHVHMREPGFEEKATFLSEGKACAKGGYTHVFAMPNTDPAPESLETYRLIREKSLESLVDVTLVGSITKKADRKRLSAMEELIQEGVRVFSDDGIAVGDPELLKSAMKLALPGNATLLLHEEDTTMFSVGAVNRGSVSTALGLDGIPNASESAMIERDIALSREIPAKLHFCHVSAKESVEAIRQAKAEGLNVSAEAAPQHFSLTEEEVLRVGTLAKVNPPLRTSSDVMAVIEGLQDGTIDMIATDHAPHDKKSKELPIALASNGFSGIELSLSLALEYLVKPHHLTIEEVIRKLTLEPARRFDLSLEGAIKEGYKADLVLLDLNSSWTVSEHTLLSKGKNTPFLGVTLPGEVVWTMSEGEIIYERAEA